MVFISKMPSASNVSVLSETVFFLTNVKHMKPFEQENDM